MNMFKNIYKVCAAALLTLGVFGCQEQEMVKPYALLAESSLTFAAQGAEAQVLTIASEEDWIVDVDSDWIDIDVTSGSGTVYANVSVTDNVDANGAMAAPRQGKITIAVTRGNYSVETVIYQKGDTYLEARECSVSELAALENTEETPQIPVKVKDAMVVAVANDGFVISDGTTNVLVSGAREVAAGNKVSLNGQKVSMGGLPVLIVDEVLANDNGTEATYPTATDISSAIDSYKSDKVEYVSVSGTLVDNTILNIAGTSKSVTLYKAAALADYNIHKVTVSGYYAGTVNGAPNIVAANIKSNGEDTEFGSPFPFNDDFSWLDPFIEMANSGLSAANQISDCVGSVISSADGACNIYTTLAGKVPVLETLRERGYVDLNPGLKTIYLQNAYLKFGATKKQSGLRLPFLKIEGTQDIAVSFRWCSQMQGDGKIDDTRMVVAFTGPGSIDGMKESTKVPGQMVSPDMNHTQETNKMFWNDALVIIKGATRATSITIRPCDDVFGPENDPVSSVHRFYMDDISVVNAADAVQSKITVSGVENNLITFEGTPEGPAQFEVSADKDYKILTSAKWFSVSETEGLGGETKTVEVTCEPSELSTLRQGTIIIKSGTSTYTISIVQSAAGQTLASFVSLVGGNSGTVNFDAGSFNIDVQSNVDYEFESDASWVTVQKVETKALVETSTLAVNYEANAVEADRVAHIRVFNAKENVETVYTLTQGAFVSGVYFKDDFSWMADLIAEYNAANAKPVGNTVRDGLANSEAPNMGTAEPFKSKFLPLFTEKGYALAGTLNTYYAQDAYLKFSKTKKDSGNALVITAPFATETAPSANARIEFDWAAMIQGDGAIDATVLLIRIEGDGTFANGTKYSNPLHHAQQTNQMFWNHVSVPVFGVSANTKLTIVRDKCVNTETGEYDFNSDFGAGRWFIDNIMISKNEPKAIAKWNLGKETMGSYKSLFDTPAGDATKAGGFGDSYLPAQEGNGKIQYWSIDKTAIDVNTKFDRVIGTTGEPYVDGAWPGDYWYFNATADVAAGTVVHAYFVERASGTGMKYWLVEYKDNGEWKPAFETKTVDIEGQGTITYNIELMNTAELPVDVTFVTTAATNAIEIRSTCAANAQASGKGPLAAPNGGTVRLKGAEKSPYIEIFE